MKNVVLVGSGGYGAGYLPILFEKERELCWRLCGVVDPYAAAGSRYESIVAHQVPVYDTPEAFFAENSADIAIIATPIMLHCAQAVYCLEQGCDVLLEKPVAGSVQDAERIGEAMRRTGKKAVVGFQWCADAAMLRFKRDADAGRFGRLLSQKALVLWPRDYAYFNRGTKWAGRCYDKNGTAIFDSIASNATAHYLFNEMWIAGSGFEASPVTEAHWSASRANAIETYDTVEITGKTRNGASLFFAASHAVAPEDQLNPVFEYRFEAGTAYFSKEGHPEKSLFVELQDGTVVDYGISDNGGMEQKVFCAAGYFAGQNENVCPIEGAVRHISLLETLWNGGEAVKPLAEGEVIRGEDRAVGIGIAAKLREDYRNA